MGGSILQVDSPLFLSVPRACAGGWGGVGWLDVCSLNSGIEEDVLIVEFAFFFLSLLEWDGGTAGDNKIMP